MKILLVHPPMTVSRDFIDYPYFADLGAVQLAGALVAAGHEVDLVDAFALPDATMHWRRDGRAHLGGSLGSLFTEVASRPRPELVVVCVTPFHRPPHRDDVLAATLRGLSAIAPEAPLVLADAYQSGQHYVEAEDLRQSYPEADAWVKYEAELTVPALVEAFESRGERPEGVHRGESPPDLDALALPAWHLVDLDRHDAFRARVVRRAGRAEWAFPIGGRTLPMITSRGCPFRCAHCSSNPGLEAGEKKIQRRLSPARVREAITALRGHGVERVAILDELVNVRASHFDAVLDALEEEGLRFEVPNGLRADYLSHEQLARMSGRVTTVSVSAESGSQRVLDEIVGKQLDLAAIERVAEDAHALGVPLMIHWIIGLPGERAEEINQTLELALSLYDRFRAWPAVQYSTPLPGTALAEGRSLPVVDDWGPRFQHHPSQPGALVDEETLRKFRWTFERRLSASRGPEKIILNLTYACNNKCSFCAVGTRTQFHGDEDAQRGHLVHYREKGVTLVDFDGGEPTLHPNLHGIIAFSRELGYERVNVTTNGRRLADEAYAKSLVESGLTSLLFSVHGPDARIHNIQVGVPRAFEETTLGIQHAVRHAPAGLELGMNITLTKGNHQHLEAMTALAFSLGLPWLNVQFLTPFGRATKRIAPDTAEAARITMEVIDRWKDRMKIHVINLPFCMMPGYEAHLEGDLNKLARHMVFVNNESVNLAEYLAERRRREPICEPCPHACFCGGFYELEDVPEPPWLIAPEDLVRPLRGAGV